MNQPIFVKAGQTGETPAVPILFVNAANFDQAGILVFGARAQTRSVPNKSVRFSRSEGA